MRPKRPNYHREQQTSKELLDDLMAFVQLKFYPGHWVEFRKDYKPLLTMVVLYPAVWLKERGVTLPDDQYKKLLTDVLMVALQLGKTEAVRWMPAYLGRVVQSHFDHHGDEIYERAKSIRTIAEHALLSAGKAAVARPDPVRELAVAARLVKPKKTAPKPAVKAQLTLFG